MNNYCKYLKKRKNKPFCTLGQNGITFSQCWECMNKEYKQLRKNSAKTLQKYTKCRGDVAVMSQKRSNKLTSIKRESSKHRKSDKNRFSIIVDDLSKCCVCGSTTEIAKHEVFYGAYRHVSIKYGLIIPLCPFHHTVGKFAIHNDRNLDLYYKRFAQSIFEKKYSHELFIKEFKINYLNRNK